MSLASVKFAGANKIPLPSKDDDDEADGSDGDDGDDGCENVVADISLSNSSFGIGTNGNE